MRYTDKLRVNRNGQLHRLFRARSIASTDQRETQIAIKLGGERIDTQAPVKHIDGVLPLASGVKSHAELRVRGEQVGFEQNGPPVCLYLLRVTAQLTQHQS